MGGEILGLEAWFSEGGELSIGQIFELLEGGRGDAAEGEDAFLGVDVDLDVDCGIVGRDVAVPPHVDVPVEPAPLQVLGL